MGQESKKTFFYQGLNIIEDNQKNSIKIIKEKISEFTKIKNINFLFGAGTSSKAIPNMTAMKKELEEKLEEGTALKTLYKTFIDDNLENLLGAMYSKKHYLSKQEGEEQNNEQEEIKKLIKYIEDFIYKKININLIISEDGKTLELYKSFYQKITLRNKDLARVNVFTTNNDLFNEKAMDDLNINYNNGFGGGLERVFNPARFRHTFSQKIDENLDKFEPIENMIYLYKLHGSISWVEKDTNSLFGIQEVAVKGGEEKTKDDNQVLIYPTPLKQGQSLGSPYTDLIREFQTKLSYKNSVLFVIGYSFSDEHINNIIYQSLVSNSSLIVVMFGEHKECPLSKIDDNRIYRIFGKDGNEKMHYFKYIVEQLLSNLDENKEQTLLNNFLKALKEEKKQL